MKKFIIVPLVLAVSFAIVGCTSEDTHVEKNSQKNKKADGKIVWKGKYASVRYYKLYQNEDAKGVCYVKWKVTNTSKKHISITTDPTHSYADGNQVLIASGIPIELDHGKSSTIPIYFSASKIPKKVETKVVVMDGNAKILETSKKITFTK